MNTLQRIEVFEQVLSRQLDWIRVTDTRGAFVLALSTALLATLGTLVSWTERPVDCSLLIVVIPAAIPELVAVAYAWLAAYPQTSGPKRSMIFFGGINEFQPNEYVSKAQKIDADAYFEDLAKQCHRNGQIAKAKYKHITWALMWLYGAVIAWIICAVILIATSDMPAS